MKEFVMYIKLKNRGAEIRKENTSSCEMYVVDFYEDDVIVESRDLPGKSIYYARDTAENWVNGIIEKAQCN
jgi:hypothetical protein